MACGMMEDPYLPVEVQFAHCRLLAIDMLCVCVCFPVIQVSWWCGCPIGSTDISGCRFHCRPAAGVQVPWEEKAKKTRAWDGLGGFRWQFA